MSTDDNERGEQVQSLATRSDPEPPQASAAAPSGDVMFLHSRCESKEGFRVIRSRADRIEIGEIHELREGAPVHGEVVELAQRPEHQQLFDVKVLLDQTEVRKATGSGPAQVATDAYRTHWEVVFGDSERGSSPPSDELN